VVTSADIPISVTYEGSDAGVTASLTVDGQWHVPAQVGDRFVIRKADVPLRLCPPEGGVFDVLAAKLGWSGPPRIRG
jgi:NAD kinase